MAVTVRIPTTLRPLSGGNATVSVEGATLVEVLKNLGYAGSELERIVGSGAFGDVKLQAAE